MSDATMKVDDDDAQLSKDNSFFGNPSQNAYMLVYRQRDDYRALSHTKEELSDMTFIKSVEKLNAELEQKIKQYGQEKEKLSMEINKTKQQLQRLV